MLSQNQILFGNKRLQEVAISWDVPILKAARILASKEINEFWKWINADEFLNDKLKETQNFFEKEYSMTEQCNYYSFTKDIKILTKYAKKYALNESIVEAAERISTAIKKDLIDYSIPVTPVTQVNKRIIKMFEKEKKQYAEDCKTHERSWELWQYAVKNSDVLDWCDLSSAPIWKDHLVYRRKITSFVPEYYSGLNWSDAEHLIGKTVECTNNPERVWKDGILQKIEPTGKNFYVDGCSFYTYIRTCEETFKHPTINIGGVYLPMPETVAPANETKYWMFPYHANRKLFHSFSWSGAPYVIAALQAGQVHLTEDRAQAWADWWKTTVIDKMK